MNGEKALTCRSEEEQSSRNQPVESHVEPFRPRLYFEGKKTLKLFQVT